MNVLLTGAFGNIGTSTLEELLKQGHRVRCFDLETKANRKKARVFGDRIEVVWGDLRHPEDVAQAVRDQDVVLHLAFIIPKMSATGIESEEQPDWAREINVGGTRNLIEAMHALPSPPKLIFASSYHIYGRTQDRPPPRTIEEPIDPVEHYSYHKAECEEMVRASGLTWSIFRLSATLPLAIQLDPGMFDVPLANRMEFTFTRDVGLAFANGAGSDEIWGKTLLIGGGSRCQYVYHEIVGRILGAMGVGRLPDEAFGTTPFCTDWVDSSASQRFLQYQRHDLGDYIEEMVKLVGFRRHLIRLIRPIVRWWLLRKSPYYRDAKARAAWRGKVAVVTGASGGIGAVTARLLAKKGLRVVLVARSRDTLERIAAEIRAAGGEALAIAADLTEEADHVRLVEAVKATYGTADVLVNNAGLGWYGFGDQMPWSMARQMLQLNVSAVVRLTLLFLAEMKERGRGHVINIGSVAGSLPNQGIALYGATKSFVDSFTTALYRELRGTRVHVSVIRAGAVATGFFERASNQLAAMRMPGGKLSVKPEAVAKQVWELLKKPARVSYVPRSLSFVPWIEPAFGWLLDRLGPLLLRRQARPVPVRSRRRRR